MIIHCCRNRGWNQKQKPLAVTRRKTPDDKMISKGGCIKSPKRFCMVGTRYFASASNDWYSIWYHSYGRTWSITSLPGLVFRRRRAVFILLAMPPTSQEGGVRGVVWLIQAPAWNQTCHSTNDRCEALASPKGCFLCFWFHSQFGNKA